MITHLHVSSNTPGYLPTVAPACFDDIDRALEHLRAELCSQRDDFSQQCQGCRPDGQGDPCPWCEVADDVETALSDIADGDVRSYLRRGDVGWNFRPPEGPDIGIWCEHIDSAAATCELADRQFA
ncbi:hypothetical protein [Streptomyces millisiae]|uniref:Uncharacterized protein n=1 Tax=Streptomyces millisiae TaxID=3075542 RepID=A0ABU2LLR0_9ACTN|nr:hypothetical protein [Streptomyces sp. DSM 44918]MDT0318518.1 hypothetical protein [Streptomyces sp. DSM 44918]